MTNTYGWPTPVDAGHLEVKPGDRFLRDTKGRAWLLRGVNLSGASKFPKYPVSVGSHIGSLAFLDDNNVNDNSSDEEQTKKDEISFVGRPFELQDADEHLSRLRHWGFRLLRWVVTWEAIEHKGPGQYDEEFLDYTVQALDKAREYGFKVMIDFHQDVWSRFTGGSGAPLWTLYAAGLDPAHFHTTGAALVHNLWTSSSSSSSSSEGSTVFPRMGWLTNYYKLACATMFTLFYAGSILAPRCTLEGGVNIQEYLQRHFVQAMVVLAKRIRDYKGGVLMGLEQGNDGGNSGAVVLGWDSWNEPSPGWIGLDRLDVLPDEHDARQADMPTPFQALQLGQGLAVEQCQTFTIHPLFGPTATGTRTIDPTNGGGGSGGGARAWLTAAKRDAMDRRYGIRRDPSFPRAHECLWAQHGVWSVSERRILQQDYFKVGPDPTHAPLNWAGELWTAFALRVTEAIRQVQPGAVLFLEPPVYQPPPNLVRASNEKKEWLPLLDNMVFTPHHYDDLALVIRRYFDWANIDLLGLSRKRRSSLLNAVTVGRQNSRLLYGQQIGSMVEESDANLGVRPVLIGETGVPMDLEMESTTAAKPLWKRVLSPLVSFSSSDATATNSNGKGDRYTYQGTSPLFLQCFDNILQGLDRNLVHYTLWNYTAENTAEHGDHWNGENLSLFSKEQQYMEEKEAEVAVTELDRITQRRQHVLDRGARALDLFCRPYPIVTVGTPIRIEFDRHQKVFQIRVSKGLDSGRALERSAAAVGTLGMVLDHPSTERKMAAQGMSKEEHQARLMSAARLGLATEIYIPEHHFGSTNTTVCVSEGDWFWDREQQILYWYYDQQEDQDSSNPSIVSLRMTSPKK
ncbi:hypothetical protein BGZ73_005095 [Actinomortierella ambigua]|nr:hypothetical protein BGZ73_005095 [Actinomortierella ambigua]